MMGQEKQDECDVKYEQNGNDDILLIFFILTLTAKYFSV